MKTAKTRGTKTGRPIGRPKRVFDRAEVVRLRAEGISIQQIAKKLKVGVGTVARTLQSHTG